VTYVTTSFKAKEVDIQFNNGPADDDIITAITNLNWPAADGKLLKIQLGGDVIYDAGPAGIASGPLSLTTAQLIADANKRTIKKGEKGDHGIVKLIFQNNVSTNTALYDLTVNFGTNSLTPF
jgi:hypothetical protein